MDKSFLASFSRSFTSLDLRLAMAAPSDIRSPLEHDKHLVTLLGTMAARWTLVEAAMTHLFSKMLRDEPAARAIYQAANSFRTRVEIIRETAWVFCIYESDWEQISKLLSDTYNAFKKRSTFIHQPYHAEVEDAVWRCTRSIHHGCRQESVTTGDIFTTRIFRNRGAF